MPVVRQVNSQSDHPEIAPTMVSFRLGSVDLQAWIHKDVARGLVQFMVKKQSDTRSWLECEKYAIFTITADGECYRNSGLPLDWGFRLTKERRIKEVS